MLRDRLSQGCLHVSILVCRRSDGMEGIAAHGSVQDSKKGTRVFKIQLYRQSSILGRHAFRCGCLYIQQEMGVQVNRELALSESSESRSVYRMNSGRKPSHVAGCIVQYSTVVMPT